MPSGTFFQLGKPLRSVAASYFLNRLNFEPTPEMTSVMMRPVLKAIKGFVTRS